MTHLIFLHGLLGSKDDWKAIIEQLKEELTINRRHFICHSIDLPFHGEEKHTEVKSFEQTEYYLQNKIQQLAKNEPYILIGYSLGGRIALHHGLLHSSKELIAIILEGTNLGLLTQEERTARWKNDFHWAHRFINESLENVLVDWYQQNIFSYLTLSERDKLIEKRRQNCGKNIGKMLLATSLAKQPDFSTQVQSTLIPIFYFCGEKDHKFQTMAKKNKLNMVSIPYAGHNAHLDNPKFFTEKLLEVICHLLKHGIM